MIRLAAALWLAIVLAAGAYLACRVGSGLTFRTDLMALLPMDQQDATAVELGKGLVAAESVVSWTTAVTAQIFH